MPPATNGPGTSNQIEGHKIAYKLIRNYFESNVNIVDDYKIVTMMSTEQSDSTLTFQ